MTGEAWREQWEMDRGYLVHRDCGGIVYFRAPDSTGDPTVATCERCEATWRRAYGWMQERLTGRHRPGLPDPPNLRPEAEWE